MDTDKIKNRAKELLNAKYGIVMPCVLFSILLPLIITTINEESGLLTFIALSPIPFGLASVMLKVQRGKRAAFEDLFSGYSKYFFNTLLLNAVISLLSILGAVLLVVPGIIIALRYSMSWFILADNPEMGFREVMRRSRELMDGRKEELFFFILSYLGWFILSLLTGGVLFILYVGPYLYLALAGYYLNITENNRGRSKEEEEEDSYNPPRIGGVIE